MSLFDLTSSITLDLIECAKIYTYNNPKTSDPDIVQLEKKKNSVKVKGEHFGFFVLGQIIYLTV